MKTHSNCKFVMPSQLFAETGAPAPKLRVIFRARETEIDTYDITDPEQKKAYIAELKKISGREYGKLKWRYKFFPEKSRVFYAFSEKQLEEGMVENGYSDKTELQQDYMGAIGSATELAAYNREFFYRYALFKAIIMQYFRPEEVYIYEFGNHECAYTWDDTEAVGKVQEFWPGWTPQPEFKHMLLTETL